ncbi:MAG: polysaccharide deacetylase family protein, partial [Acidobacteria bacterium]|nr:polysaccharide deacetylase family protein [Acidobacteriota bacterium]
MLVLATAACAAALAAATYQSLAPRGQWFGKSFHGIERGSRQIALTFDDGPNDPHTLKLLEILDKHAVRATFFLIGRHVRQRPDIAATIAAQGHTVGNHTFSHPLLIFQPRSRIEEEIITCQQALRDAVAEPSNLFRPPWGGRRPGIFRFVRGLGLEPVLWSVTGYDWNAPSADYIEKKVQAQIRGGDVVLLHDG